MNPTCAYNSILVELGPYSYPRLAYLEAVPLQEYMAADAHGSSINFKIIEGDVYDSKGAKKIITAVDTAVIIIGN